MSKAAVPLSIVPLVIILASMEESDKGQKAGNQLEVETCGLVDPKLESTNQARQLPRFTMDRQKGHDMAGNIQIDALLI